MSELTIMRYDGNVYTMPLTISYDDPNACDKADIKPPAHRASLRHESADAAPADLSCALEILFMHGCNPATFKAWRVPNGKEFVTHLVGSP